MKAKLGGTMKFICRNADGSLAWEEEVPLEIHRDGNGVTNAGVGLMVNIFANKATQTGHWYLGLVDLANFTAFAAGDTMASHSGWQEFTHYTQSTRLEWIPENGFVNGVPGVLAGAPAAPFTMDSTAGTIKGAFLSTDSTKAGVAGTLWATGALSSPQTLTSGQSITIIHTITLTPA